MKRRGFLGFLGGAAVAGPSMAKQAVTTGLEGLSIGSGSQVIGGTLASAGYAAQGPLDPYDPVRWATRELNEFIGRSASELLRERLETHVDRLDPDIAGMQAIALQAKIRMQRDRNFERNRAQQRGWLEREVQSAVKRMSA